MSIRGIGVGQLGASWMATLKSDLSLHNLTFEDAIELALDKSLWRLLVASYALTWCMPNNDDDDGGVLMVNTSVLMSAMSSLFQDIKFPKNLQP